MDSRLCEIGWRSCVLSIYCRQASATFSSHFHTTWGPPFRDSLYVSPLFPSQGGHQHRIHRPPKHVACTLSSWEGRFVSGGRAARGRGREVHSLRFVGDDIKILGHCSVYACLSVHSKWDDIEISTVCLKIHTSVRWRQREVPGWFEGGREGGLNLTGIII